MPTKYELLCDKNLKQISCGSVLKAFTNPCAACQSVRRIIILKENAPTSKLEASLDWFIFYQNE